MLLPRCFTSRQSAARLGLVSLSAFVLLARPSRGQQPSAAQPDVQASVPATASAGRTRVDYSLALPAGLQLMDWPAVRVLDQSGKLVEYAGMEILQRTPRLIGFHRLWTETYPPGTYSVRIEFHFQRPDGTTTLFSTPAARLTVPG